MNEAIVAGGVSKQYTRQHPAHPTTLGEVLAQGLRRFRPAQHAWALRDVSFAIAPGKMVGIIGANGAGKSTLLRLIGGISQPEEGTLQVAGRIGALLDLGAGFHPDLTGRENIFVSGVISGLTRREVRSRLDAIVDFAELAPQIDEPLRTYSTGMQMRLAFAIAVHTEPEILLIDEVLAVGDIAFQRKCLERILAFKAQGCTILLVSHDPHQVERLCDEAIWLHHGRLAAHGTAPVVTGQYLAEMRAETQRRTAGASPAAQAPTGQRLHLNENRFGSQELVITAVRLLDAQGQAVAEVNSGEALLVQIGYEAPQPIDAPIFGATITREDGLICYETSTQATGLALPTIQGAGQVTLHIDRLDLMQGAYFLDVGVYEKSWAYAYDYHWHVYPLTAHSAIAGKGVLQPPHYWQLESPAPTLPRNGGQVYKPAGN